jgi:hypothetical protein
MLLVSQFLSTNALAGVAWNVQRASRERTETSTVGTLPAMSANTWLDGSIGVDWGGQVRHNFCCDGPLAREEASVALVSVVGGRPLTDH